ncbi:hypothetical protein H5410_032787 [Solanum commersonii]|uniref:Uncharacterized protein n=1 Tax=Solanum commersonii TaxID=4109 RepID=A0A9J5YM03_SOLCO|nr:hypothetical protein H5410_032787 [Solanum commersonii]
MPSIPNPFPKPNKINNNNVQQPTNRPTPSIPSPLPLTRPKFNFFFHKETRPLRTSFFYVNPTAHVNQTAAVCIFFYLTRQYPTTPTAFSAIAAHLDLFIPILGDFS